MNDVTKMALRSFGKEIYQGATERRKTAELIGIPEQDLIRSDLQLTDEAAYGIPLQQKQTELGAEGVTPISPGNAYLARKPIYEETNRMLRENPSILNEIKQNMQSFNPAKYLNEKMINGFNADSYLNEKNKMGNQEPIPANQNNQGF